MESHTKLGFTLAVMAVLLLATETSPAPASRAQGGLPLAILGDGKALENAIPSQCSLSGQTCSIETDEFVCCSGCSCFVPESPGFCNGSCAGPPKCTPNGEICLNIGPSPCCSGCFCDAPPVWPPVPGVCRGSCAPAPPCSNKYETCASWSPCCSGCFCQVTTPPPKYGYCTGSCPDPERYEVSYQPNSYPKHK